MPIICPPIFVVERCVGFCLPLALGKGFWFLPSFFFWGLFTSSCTNSFSFPLLCCFDLMEFLVYLKLFYFNQGILCVEDRDYLVEKPFVEMEHFSD